MKSSFDSGERLRLAAQPKCRRDADANTRDACAPWKWIAVSSFIVGVLTLTGPHLCAEPTPSVPNRFVRDGVAVELILSPVDTLARSEPARAGDASRIRFTITETTTGKPLTRLHPAAWLSRRDPRNPARPQTSAQKIQELLGGSLFSKADLDLNTFQVITLNDDATLTVVDPLFGFGGTKLLALIPLPGVGADWALSCDQKKLFVAVPDAGKIVVIDTAQWKVSATVAVEGSPNRVAVQPDGHYLWVTSTSLRSDSTEDQLTGVETDQVKAVAAISLPRGPHEMVFSPDSHWAFVASAASQTLSVIEVARLQKTKDLPLDGKPTAAAYSKASDAVYLVDAQAGAILVVDAVKHDLVGRILTAPGISELKFAPDDRFGFIANPERGFIEILDTATNRIVQRAKIGDGPEQIGFSGDMAFVLCRSTASVAMIPLNEIGREGQPVPVAQFVGGEASFGTRQNHADSIMAAPGESAVVVANAKDKAVYYYMQGMAAPMGNFSNYGREPRAVMVVDRSLREVGPGVYETMVDLPPAGNYDAVFFLDSPRITHCFLATIDSPRGGESPPDAAVARLRALPQQTLVANERIRLAFQLEGQIDATSPAEISLLAVLTPGIWHSRQIVTSEPGGRVTFEFTPPKAGSYQFYAESALFGREPSRTPILVLHASESSISPAQ